MSWLKIYFLWGFRVGFIRFLFLFLFFPHSILFQMEIIIRSSISNFHIYSTYFITNKINIIDTITSIITFRYGSNYLSISGFGWGSIQFQVQVLCVQVGLRVDGYWFCVFSWVVSRRKLFYQIWVRFGASCLKKKWPGSSRVIHGSLKRFAEDPIFDKTIELFFFIFVLLSYINIIFILINFVNWSKDKNKRFI